MGLTSSHRLRARNGTSPTAADIVLDDLGRGLIEDLDVGVSAGRWLPLI